MKLFGKSAHGAIEHGKVERVVVLGCNKTKVHFSHAHLLKLLTTNERLLEANFYHQPPFINTSWAVYLSLRTLEDNKTVASLVFSHTPGQSNDDLLDIECYGNTSITAHTDPWTLNDSYLVATRGIKLQEVIV
ncbi:hypothetical protein Pcinc_010185 [Petrolisthes cinctipes]|uniref:Uncharacterized protein n=1 Tax=Petrolisthes cinctipes TaxID=88211 RepID=A0AAE1KVK6_PETCI|nr:hypothetical protein Pcinc_010185 [Petrolisthes cinctipes]